MVVKTTEVWIKKIMYTRHCEKCGNELNSESNVVLDTKWNDGWEDFGGESHFCNLECLKNHELYLNDCDDNTVTLSIKMSVKDFKEKYI